MTEKDEMIYFSETLQHPFFNKQIVFTGALTTMTRSMAAKKARLHGAIIRGAVTKETDFVILGDKHRGKSTKQLKAEQLIHLGIDIQIIEESDFLWLISFNQT